MIQGCSIAPEVIDQGYAVVEKHRQAVVYLDSNVCMTTC
jgi:hypothetical protein